MNALLLTLAFATPVFRPAVEQGIHVHYLDALQPQQRYWPREARYERNVKRAKRALRGVSSAGLARLIQRATQGEKWFELPCYECVAAIELLGERGKSARSAEILERAFSARIGHLYGPTWKPDEIRYRTTLVKSWSNAAIGDLDERQAFDWVRAVFATERPRAIRLNAAWALLRRDVDRHGKWPPAVMKLFDDPSGVVRGRVLGMVSWHDSTIPERVRDRLLQFLLDPDPKLRARVAQALAAPLHWGELWVPSLIRFLNRSDITPEAWLAAEKGLEARGYVAKKVGGRWVAQPKPLLDRYLGP